MNERKVRMLKFLYDATAANSGTSALSYRMLARALGISPIQARTAVSLLQQDGLIEAHSRYLPNGAQLENLYRLTPKGAAALRLLAQRVEEAEPCPA